MAGFPNIPNSAGFAPIVDSLWIPASQMSPVIGTVVDGDISDTWHFAELSDGTIDGVGTTLVLPSHWSTYKATAVCVNPTVSTGDVVMRLDHGEAADGETLPRTTEPTITATAGAQDVRTDFVLLAESAAITAGELQAVAVYRLGSDAADTLAANYGLLGLLLEKVS